MVRRCHPPRRLGTPSRAFLALLLGLCLGGPGCKPQGVYDHRIAVIPKGTTHVFWKSIHAGACQAEKSLREAGKKVEVIWQGPLREDDREMQIQIVESFVGQNVDGIVLAPLDAHAMKGPVVRAMAAGTPVVIIDSGLEGETYVSYIATDNTQGGVLAGERIGELLGGKGKVLLLRYAVGSASTTQREQGFIDTIREKHPAIELVPPGLEQYAGATVGRAQEAAETLLNTYSDIDGIFCPNESSTTGMLQALRNTPLLGKVRFVGFDANEKLIEALRSGHLEGLVLQDPVKMGRLGVLKMAEHLEGKPVEKQIDTGVYLITRENMDGTREKALLAPDLSILEK